MREPGSSSGFVGVLAPPPLTLHLLPNPRDAICGQLQCQGGRAQPLLGSARDLHWEMLEANGTQLKLNCSWVHLDLGNDVAQPLMTLPGTACGPGLVSSLGGQHQVGRDIWTAAGSAQASLATGEEGAGSHFRWSRVPLPSEPWFPHL